MALVTSSTHSAHSICPRLSQAPVQCRDLVLCLLVQSHGVQPEERLPLPVATRGFPVLTAASEQEEPLKVVARPGARSDSELGQEGVLRQPGKYRSSLQHPTCHTRGDLPALPLDLQVGGWMVTGGSVL